MGAMTTQDGDRARESLLVNETEVALASATTTTRLVGLQFGGRFYRLGWVEVSPGESMSAALAAMMRAVADRMEHHARDV
jgi:hypothetical protein